MKIKQSGTAAIFLSAAGLVAGCDGSPDRNSYTPPSADSIRPGESEPVRPLRSPSPLAMRDVPYRAFEECKRGAEVTTAIAVAGAIASCTFDALGGVVFTAGSVCAVGVGAAKLVVVSAAAGCAVGAITHNPNAGAGIGVPSPN